MPKDIDIKKYTTIDVYYSEETINEYNKIKKRLLKNGYEINFEDTASSNDYDYCDQYIKYNYIKK